MPSIKPLWFNSYPTLICISAINEATIHTRKSKALHSMNQTENNINLFITNKCIYNTNLSVINNGVWIRKLNNPTGIK
jgi:hypothetical protein